MPKLSYSNDPGSTRIVLYSCVKITQNIINLFMRVEDQENYIIFLSLNVTI